MATTQKITPCLWFNFNAEDAVAFYLSIFPDSRETGRLLYGPDQMGPEGKVLTINFELMGQEYIALNGGPQFPHTNAISLMVKCDDQNEVDYYWDKLMADGGSPQACGWLNDKFGVPWQVAPKKLLTMISDPDPARANRVMQAMMQMIKLDLPALEAAYNTEN